MTMSTSKIRSLARSATCLAILLFALAFVTVDAASQKPAWYGKFSVTISGTGHKDSERIGDSEIDWSIDRNYIGLFQLTAGPYRARAGAAIDKTKESYVSTNANGSTSIITVSINDKVVQLWGSPGEMETHEDKMVTTTWTTRNGPDTGSPKTAELVIDKTAGNYYFYFPLYPETTDKNVKMSRQTTIDRSDAGYGGKPPHEVLDPLEDKIGINAIPPPDLDIFVRGVGKGSYYVNPESKPLPASYPNLIEVRRTCLPPGKISLAGVPPGLATAEVCFEYTLSKTPIR